MRTEHIGTDCLECGGRVYAQTTILGDFTGHWLHPYDKDWVDRPHHAAVVPEAAERLTDVVRKQERYWQEFAAARQG